MNDYIVNPIFFYWMRTLGILTDTVGVLAAVSGIALLTLLIVKFISELQEDDYDTLSPKQLILVNRYFKYIGIIFVAAMLLAVSVPGPDTLIKMEIARNVTYSKVGQVKDSLKKDIIDIINAINKQKDKQ